MSGWHTGIEERRLGGRGGGRGNKRTGAVEERELDDVRRADPGDGLLDVLEAGVLELLLLGGVGGVADEVLGDEGLADGGAPVRGRLGEDRAELCGRALVHLRVAVRESDGTGGGDVWSERCGRENSDR